MPRMVHAARGGPSKAVQSNPSVLASQRREPTGARRRCPAKDVAVAPAIHAQTARGRAGVAGH
eukprot:744457-Lingulodinium_polyedra.AAC.1